MFSGARSSRIFCTRVSGISGLACCSASSAHGRMSSNCSSSPAAPAFKRASTARNAGAPLGTCKICCASSRPGSAWSYFFCVAAQPDEVESSRGIKNRIRIGIDFMPSNMPGGRARIKTALPGYDNGLLNICLIEYWLDTAQCERARAGSRRAQRRLVRIVATSEREGLAARAPGYVSATWGCDARQKRCAFVGLSRIDIHRMW